MRATRCYLAARLSSALIAGALLVLVAGCSGPQATTSIPTDTPRAASLPTSSPTPATARVVLVAPAMEGNATDASLLGQVQVAMQDLAAGEEVEFGRLEALPNDDAAGIALLVVLPPDPGLQAWAQSHPAVRAVSLGIPGVQPASNLTVIAPAGLRYDQVGFALGYLAAMVTPEYRVGAIPLDGSTPSIALARGFVAGGTYYCGLCRPIHPPYIEYPAYLAGGPSELADGRVSTLLVAPQPQSLSDLGLPPNLGMALVGVGVPAGELAPAWIASAEFDVAAALEEAWRQSLAGQGGTVIPLGIRFHSIDPDVVSEGRLRLAETLLPDLSAGLIDTGVDPLTGELR